jgi:hypothetical protein
MTIALCTLSHVYCLLQAAERESAAVGASGAGLLSQSLGDAKVWCSVSGESTAATASHLPSSLSSITRSRKAVSIDA